MTDMWLSLLLLMLLWLQSQGVSALDPVMKFWRDVWVEIRPFLVEKTVAILKFITIVVAGLIIEVVGKAL